MGKDKKLDAHLSPMAVWAFSIGTSVGWGSLVVTSNTYLSQSGPMGSVLGLVIGTLVMMVIGLNYAYMMKGYPDSGGAFSFTREAFGDDQGFLAAWFVAMTYFAILWANITSLPLFGRIFMGNIFRAGKMYTIFGYDVYLGEVLLSMTAIILIGLLCCGFKKSVDYIMIVLALLFSAGIVVCFIASFLKKSVNISPVYIPDSSVFSQIIKIAVISPWAFIGFESISHGTEEMKFDNKKIKKILIASIISTMLLYVFVTLTSVTAYPDRYGSWLEYINDIDNLDGIEALPAFYAANAYMGDYFSKPVSKIDFDTFIDERINSGFEPEKQKNSENKKTYMSITRGLNCEYESIYYIDMNTDYYLKFYSGSEGEIRLNLGESSFFDGGDEILLDGVTGDDRIRLESELTRENLWNWINKDDEIALTFKKQSDVGLTDYCINLLHTRNRDNHHVVLGVRKA